MERKRRGWCGGCRVGCMVVVGGLREVKKRKSRKTSRRGGKGEMGRSSRRWSQRVRRRESERGGWSGRSDA